MEILDVLAILFGTLFLLWVFVLLWGLCCYLIKAFTIFALAKRANAKNRWLAFIPIVQNAKIFNLAGFTDKAFYITLLVFFIAYLIPIAEWIYIVSILQIALILYVRIRVAKNFGGGIATQILMCLFEPIMLIYFALSNKTYTVTPMSEYVETFIKKCNSLTNPKKQEKQTDCKSEPIDIPIVENQNN